MSKEQAIYLKIDDDKCSDGVCNWNIVPFSILVFDLHRNELNMLTCIQALHRWVNLMFGNTEKAACNR